ncbi:MAG: phospholipid carrier-dependent glycosyltransferase, partial [Actinobacteria bacterium]
MNTDKGRWIQAWWWPIALFAAAFLLRFYHLDIVRLWYDDTPINATAATIYALKGYLAPDNWWTQPAKNIVRFVFVFVFGESLLGWRMSTAVFGAASVTMAYLVARRAFRSYRVALFAAVLLMLDPLSILMGRSTSEEIVPAFFTLVAVLFCLRFLNRPNEYDLAFAASAIGTAVALRLYCAVAAVILTAAVLWRLRHELRDWWV